MRSDRRRALEVERLDVRIAPATPGAIGAAALAGLAGTAGGGVAAVAAGVGATLRVNVLPSDDPLAP